MKTQTTYYALLAGRKLILNSGIPALFRTRTKAEQGLPKQPHTRVVLVRLG